MLRKDIALRRPLLLADRTWHLRLRDWPEVRVAPGETAYRAQLLVRGSVNRRVTYVSSNKKEAIGSL